jgi:polysaccharide pyruvyl transferase WcaK-like protein
MVTRNCGDEIIAESARLEISAAIPDAFQATIPTHERLGPRSWRFLQQAHYGGIIAGSNILTDRLPFDRQWRLRPQDLLFARNLVLLGAGWRSYGRHARPLGGRVLRHILSPSAIHSVRDAFTAAQLRDRGIENVRNTACVTMWRLDLERLASLPRERAEHVVTTVNVSHQGGIDQEILARLLKSYETVFIWPQGLDDVAYIDGLAKSMPRLVVLGPTLAAYDAVLQAGLVDFVGNRLHGGIRALQKGRRALILSLDNRAAEIARDTCLPVISLENGLTALDDWLGRPDPIEIVLPKPAIAAWREQFMR